MALGRPVSTAPNGTDPTLGTLTFSHLADAFIQNDLQGQRKQSKSTKEQ